MFSIQSQGEIDVNALRLMGASVKGDDAIGEFGSGLKYAIACLIREGIYLSIYSGTRRIVISTVTEEFRGSAFQVLVIDGERTSITTRTGPKWTPREAVRELWSNALDEGEASRSVGDLMLPCTGFTTLHIGEHPAIKIMLNNWPQYFLGDVPALFDHSAFGSIHAQSTPNYFRKGVWICQEAEPLPLFSYNFTQNNCPSLPESRLVSAASCAGAMAILLGECSSEIVAAKLLGNVLRVTAEWKALYAYSYYVAAPLRNAVHAVFSATYTHVGLASKRHLIIDRIASDQEVLWCEAEAYGVLANNIHLPAIEDALAYNDRYEVAPWPIGVKEIVDERLAFLSAHGIEFPKETEFLFARFKAEETLAEADTNNMRCILSQRVANCGATHLTQALVEEWTHLEHGVYDCSVAQQHVYLNLITRLLGCK